MIVNHSLLTKGAENDLTWVFGPADGSVVSRGCGIPGQKSHTFRHKQSALFGAGIPYGLY